MCCKFPNNPTSNSDVKMVQVKKQNMEMTFESRSESSRYKICDERSVNVFMV